jgi:hypothetical protein
MEKAFEEILNATGGIKWKDKSGWMSRASLSEWRGVKVDESGQVIELNLYDNNLQGKPS